MILSLALLAAALAAPTRASVPDWQALASCAGRLTAQMEHEWLLSDPASGTTEAMLDSVAEVLELLAPPDAAGDVMARRVAARAAHRRLLSSARFSGEDWADAAARRYIVECAGMILPPAPAPASDQS